MKILYFGDIVGKVGRNGVKAVLPKLLEEHSPDFVIANAENLAHGAGITKKSIDEMLEAGIDFFTSGNHIWDKPIGQEILADPEGKVLRPANYEMSRPGRGVQEIDVNGKKLLVINLQGQVFMKHEVENPFKKINELFLQYAPKNYDAIFIDFHAETTSEKTALGWHVDGRASCIVGSHTHVPTADAKILIDGTAYITDVGMNGPHKSIIGVEVDSVLPRFTSDEKSKFTYPEKGLCDINAILVEIGAGRKAESIKLIQTQVEV